MATAAGAAKNAVEESWFKGIWNKTKDHVAIDGRRKGMAWGAGAGTVAGMTGGYFGSDNHPIGGTIGGGVIGGLAGAGTGYGIARGIARWGKKVEPAAEKAGE